MSLNRLATRDNILRRAIHIASTCCVMCGPEEESINHLLFECKVFGSVCDRSYRWVDESGVSHNQVEQNLSTSNWEI